MKEAIRGLAARPRRALGLAAHWWAWWFDSTLGFPGEGHPPGMRGDPAIGDTGSSPPAPGVHDAKGFVSTDPHPRLRRRLASRGRDNASVGVPPLAFFRLQGLVVLRHPAGRKVTRRPGGASERGGQPRPRPRSRQGPRIVGFSSDPSSPQGEALVGRDSPEPEGGRCGSPDHQPAPAGAGKRHFP
jgi:hypothetical protein